jgi:uncharacterized protein
MRFLVYVIVFVILFVLYVRFLENRTLFVPAKEILSDPSHIGIDFEDITFHTKDGMALNGWLIKAPGATSTLIFCHGNAGNIGDRLAKIKFFHDVGVNNFIFDYRGYGNSKGTPSESRMYVDAQAAYDYLLSREDIDKEKIILYGASLGGAAAIDLATRRKIAAIIIDSSFTNASDMAKRIFPFLPKALIQLKLDNVSKIKAIKVPKLFFHSKDDDIVPYELGRKLYEAADEPKLFIDLIGDHNDGHILSAEIFQDGITEFFQSHGLL